MEPFFKERHHFFSVTSSFITFWEIRKTHWWLHLMEKMRYRDLNGWPRAKTRNQTSYWGTQGSMFCCVMRVKNMYHPGSCDSLASEHRTWEKNNNKWSQRTGIIFQKSCLIFQEQNLVLFKGSSQTGHFKWRYVFPFSPTGDSSSFYLTSMFANKCLFLASGLQ